jgi:transcriptional regulator with GAF, ATPase, and Fis domain
VRAIRFGDRQQSFRLLCIEEIGGKEDSVRFAPSLMAGLPFFHTIWSSETPIAALEDHCQKIAEEVAEKLRFPVVGLELLDERGMNLKIVGLRGKGMIAKRGGALPLGQAMSGYSVQSERMMAFTFRAGRFNSEDEPLLTDESRTFVCCPLRLGHRVIGALTLVHEEAVRLEPAFKLWLGGLADCIGQSLSRYWD